MQAVINVAIAPLTTNPALWAQNPQQSRLVDELLLGMPVEITSEAEQHMVPVRTFYGYTGWVAQDALLTGPKAEEWLVQPQMVVIARWADVLAEPRVQGACVAAGLPLGARVAVQGEPEDGWQAVTLPDGRTGYLRADALAPLYTQPCEQDQEKLRAAIAQAAKRYLGTPYRWGGKTPAGIDCSGLCSMAYLLCGISIWRDSELKEGYPIHPAHVSDMRVGDLVYFPGHVALYLGNGEYIHSTARAGDNGVVINSFYPDHCRSGSRFRSSPRRVITRLHELHQNLCLFVHSSFFPKQTQKPSGPEAGGLLLFPGCDAPRKRPRREEGRAPLAGTRLGGHTL